jgi:hypothetical protein
MVPQLRAPRIVWRRESAGQSAIGRSDAADGLDLVNTLTSSTRPRANGFPPGVFGCAII